ncbi:hypothetical protein YSA_07777 [Pseudomonas putida ND6]|uniref:Uncharacterized protein n=1 Tax=Pseudomonas putida ND6 TaxID=231023 RepID=I3UZQ5_PSEPU|nr:hypothetical protein YSA_07777 [Pseudomonas putida ND6]
MQGQAAQVGENHSVSFRRLIVTQASLIDRARAVLLPAVIEEFAYE